jgi:hypothetical protein
MSGATFINKEGSVLRLLGVLLTFLTVTSFLACVAAVPVAVRYYKSSKFQTATVQVNAKAEDVHRTALRLVDEDPEIKLLKKDDKKFMVEAEKGELHGTIKTTSISEKQSQLVVTADAGEKEEDKKLALRIVTRICDKLEVKYTVVE